MKITLKGAAIKKVHDDNSIDLLCNEEQLYNCLDNVRIGIIAKYLFMRLNSGCEYGSKNKRIQDMIQKQHWFDIDRIITDEANNASVQLDIFHKDDEKRHEVYKADCLLWALWVSPPFQGRGIGTHLLQLTEEYAQREGCESVALEYDRRDSEPWVFRWYERLGYEEKEFGRYNSLMVKQLV